MEQESKQFKHWIFFSAWGSSASIAEKIHKEGRDVVLALVDDFKHIGMEEEPEEHSRRMSLFDGMVPKMTAEKVMDKLAKVPASERDGYFLFFDVNDLYKFSEKALEMGFTQGLFPTKWDFEMEEDRMMAKDFIKKHYPDLKLAPTFEFKKIEEAQKFREEDTSGNAYVLKGFDEGAKTVVPLTEDLETMWHQIFGKLEKHREDYERKGFLFETRVPNPCEFTPQCVWWDGEPVFYDVDLETKPIGSGNISFQVGAAQTMVANVHRRSRMAEIAFPKAIHSVAAKRKGLFVFDASILMDRRDGSMYYGEACANRFGYDSLYAELAMSRSASGFFENIASGINPLIRDYGVAVRMFNLPHKADYISDSLKDKEIILRHDANVWLMDAKKVDDDILTAGYGMDLAAVTGYGKHLKEAVAAAYDEIEMVGLLDAYFRPEFDFMSEDYKTSIPCRWGCVKFMAEEQMDNSLPIRSK